MFCSEKLSKLQVGIRLHSRRANEDLDKRTSVNVKNLTKSTLTENEVADQGTPHRVADFYCCFLFFFNVILQHVDEYYTILSSL